MGFAVKWLFFLSPWTVGIDLGFVSGDLFFCFALWICLVFCGGSDVIDWVSVSFGDLAKRRFLLPKASVVLRVSLFSFLCSLHRFPCPPFLCISIIWAVSLAIVLSFFVFPLSFFFFFFFGGRGGSVVGCFVALVFLFLFPHLSLVPLTFY